MQKSDLVFIPVIVGEASGVFAGFCPSWFTVSSEFFHGQGSREGNIRRIRMGEIAATIIVMATGIAISYQMKSQVPTVVSALTSAVFIAGYEWSIAHPSSEDEPDALPVNSRGALQWGKAR